MFLVEIWDPTQQNSDRVVHGFYETYRGAFYACMLQHARRNDLSGSEIRDSIQFLTRQVRNSTDFPMQFHLYECEYTISVVGDPFDLE